MISTSTQWLYIVLLMVTASPAYAQEVPGVIAVAVISPVIMVLLAGILGWLERSPISGLRHIGLIVLWVFAFVLLARSVTTDLLIWTPLVFYSIHSLYILIRLVASLRKRHGTGESDAL